MDRHIIYKKLMKSFKPRQRQYEALRLLATDHDKTINEVADKFKYNPQSIRNLYNLLIKDELNFFIEDQTGPKQSRLQADIIKKIIQLRKQNKSVEDIQDTLFKDNQTIGLSTINRIAINAGFSKLKRRTDIERGISKKNTLLNTKASNLNFKKLKPFNVDCPVAGVFYSCPTYWTQEYLRL